MGTDPRHLKITVTRDDVLASLGRAPEMNTAGDIARWVVSGVHGREGVWDAATALTHVKRADFMKLLDALTADGILMLRTGSEWHAYGAPSYLGRRNGRYYVTAEQAKKWADAKAARVAEQRRQQADVYAKGFLVERHRDEYDALVAEFFAGLEEEQGRG